jgi:hypothetical protein
MAGRAGATARAFLCRSTRRAGHLHRRVTRQPGHTIFRELPRDLFAGKILIDAMNYWEPIDGVDEELDKAPSGTSVVVQERFRSARVVKSLNQLGYHEFEENRRPRGAAGRLAIAAAGNDDAAVIAVIHLVDRLGFDAVDAGPLDAGLALEPDGPAFGVAYSADELSDLLWPRSLDTGSTRA